MMTRIFFFVFVCAVGFLLPTFFLAVAAALYAFRYSAYELIALGVVLDASYGLPTAHMPFPCLYTGTALLLVFVIGVVRPYLSLSSRTS